MRSDGDDGEQEAVEVETSRVLESLHFLSHRASTDLA